MSVSASAFPMASANAATAIASLRLFNCINLFRLFDCFGVVQLNQRLVYATQVYVDDLLVVSTLVTVSECFRKICLRFIETFLQFQEFLHRLDSYPQRVLPFLGSADLAAFNTGRVEDARPLV